MPDTRPDLSGHPVALFVFSNLREQKGGLTRAWLRRLSAFHEAGWDTHIATIHPQPEIDETLEAWREREWLPLATAVHHYQRRDKRFRPSWSRRTDEAFTRDDRVADWLDWLVGRLPGVVVFADSPVTYAPVAMMRNPFIARVMTVHLAHRKGDPPHAAQSPRNPRGRRAREIRSRYSGPVGQPRLAGRLLPFAPAADAVVALTHRQAADLVEDLPGLEVHVIPNMVDPAPADMQVDRDPVRVVQVGRLDSVKRVDHAIRAVGMAAESIPGVHLEVYGRGPELDHLRELRDALGLEDVVSFPGFTEDPVRVLAGSALSIMTSRREGFGLVVAESLSVGTPVVTYDVDYGPAELVEDGVNGRVVPDGSIGDLAAALVEVLSDPEEWRRMSGAAPAAVERLHQEVVAAQWLALAIDVARRIQIPASILLVEDLRVRRTGVMVDGVAISRSPATPPGTVGIVDQVGVSLGGASELASVGEGRADSSLVAQAVTATLPWATIGAWPHGAELRARDLTGAQVAVIGPGLPGTVCPTESGPVLLGWDASAGQVRRLSDRGSVPVALGRASVRATLDEDVTILSDVSLVTAAVVPTAGPSTQLTVELLPGLTVRGEAALTIVAGAGSTAVGVGQLVVPEGGAGGQGGAGAEGAVIGILEWDPSGLEQLLHSGATPALLWLSTGRTLRSVGPVVMPTGRVLRLEAGGRWLLAPSTSGRAMLVPGPGWRVRAGLAARRWTRKGSKV